MPCFVLYRFFICAVLCCAVLLFVLPQTLLLNDNCRAEFSLGSHSMTSDVGLSNIAVLTCIPIVSYAMGGWVKGAARYGAVGTKGRVICNTCAWKRPYPRQPQQHQQNDDAGKGAQAHNLAQQQAQTLAEPEEMAQQEEAANTAAPAVEPSPEAAADTVGKERSEL